jgi:hypothetical protein
MYAEWLTNGISHRDLSSAMGTSPKFRSCCCHGITKSQTEQQVVKNKRAASDDLPPKVWKPSTSRGQESINLPFASKNGMTSTTGDKGSQIQHELIVYRDESVVCPQHFDTNTSSFTATFPYLETNHVTMNSSSNTDLSLFIYDSTSGSNHSNGLWSLSPIELCKIMQSIP